VLISRNFTNNIHRQLKRAQPSVKEKLWIKTLHDSAAAPQPFSLGTQENKFYFFHQMNDRNNFHCFDGVIGAAFSSPEPPFLLVM